MSNKPFKINEMNQRREELEIKQQLKPKRSVFKIKQEQILKWI